MKAALAKNKTAKFSDLSRRPHGFQADYRSS